MKFYSHLNSAKQLIADYTGDQPFSGFLKAYFQLHKKHGSRDRKSIGELCYSFFRLGNALSSLDLEKRILAGLFLSLSKNSFNLAGLEPSWIQFLEDNDFPLPEERILFIRGIYPAFDENSLFPFSAPLSEGMEKTPFTLSHLRQPDLFIRIRPGYYEQTISALRSQEAAFEFIEPFTVRLPNSFRVDAVGAIDKEVVVQDYSSQQAANLMQRLKWDHSEQNQSASSPLKVWDCCAASGGKSIMAYDLLKDVELTVTDIRDLALQNLRKRFFTAGIKKYDFFKMDLSSPGSRPPVANDYDLIILDAPCSGSGTWGRTPERLSQFKEAEIDRYAQLQKKIAGNVVRFLKPGGVLLYITCSVFRRENEEAVNYLQEQTSATLRQMQCIKGYNEKADSMFAALFTC